MKLGRIIRMELTPDELITLAYNIIGTDEMRRGGIDTKLVQATVTNDSMGRLRTKIQEALPACRGPGGGKVDKDKLWSTIDTVGRGA